MAYGSFEDLDVWRSATRIAVQVYRMLRNCNDYGLKDQMTRASVSIASNIAEGSERGSNADFVRFLHIAKGSAAELRTQMYIAHHVGFIKRSSAQEMIKELKILSGKLQSLISYLKS